MNGHIHYTRRSFRELPGATTRVRGGGDLPYDRGRPLRLPHERRPRRSPQFNFGAILRLLLPLVALTGLGVGVFFGVRALRDDDEQASGTAAPAASAVTEQAESSSVSPSDQPSDVAGEEASEAAAPPIDASASQSAAPAEPAPAEAPNIITPADLGGAPVVVERGAATPIPPGFPNRTLADGTPYDPTDATLAFSSVWETGTVLQITRLPGGPLLSEEDAAELIGKTITVVVGDLGSFPTELQLSPAAFQLLAREMEPIIALRIEVVESPSR